MLSFILTFSSFLFFANIPVIHRRTVSIYFSSYFQATISEYKMKTKQISKMVVAVSVHSLL